MYSKRISFSSSTIIVLLAVLCLTDQAFARRCYKCESYASGACYTNPKLAPTVNCETGTFVNSKSTLTSGNFSLLSAISTMNTSEISPRASGTSDCATFEGYFGSNKYVARVCTQKEISCDYYKEYLQQTLKFNAKSCNRCDTDLCNSSNSLSAGILSLLSIIMILVLKM